MLSEEQGRKRSESSLARLTARQRSFVVGKMEGKSDRRAALDAGYAVSTAENTKQKIMNRPVVRQVFQDLLDEFLPAEKLVRCIVEGLNATQTKFLYRKGHINKAVVLPDHRVRFLFVILALKLKGWDLPLAEPNKPSEIVLRWQGEPPEWAQPEWDPQGGE